MDGVEFWIDATFPYERRSKAVHTMHSTDAGKLNRELTKHPMATIGMAKKRSGGATARAIRANGRKITGPAQWATNMAPSP